MSNDRIHEQVNLSLMIVPDSPERKLWFAVVEQTLIDFNAAILNCDNRAQKTLLHIADSDYFGWICDNIDIHQSHITRFMRQLQKGEVNFFDDMRYSYTNHRFKGGNKRQKELLLKRLSDFRKRRAQEQKK